MAGKKEGERGAALLTVLLLVAVVGALTAVMLEKLRVSTNLAANTAALAQARAYSRAAETMALIRIDSQLGSQNTRVTLDGGWSDKPFALPVPDGVATARVKDGGNCFNLNNLVQRDDQGNYVDRPAALAQFARLMRQIGVPDSDRIAASATDWIDTDSNVSANGAEDDTYSSRTPAYRSANTLMTDPSELRAVAGMTPQAYIKLRSFICTLPTTDAAKVNVNTLMPEQAPLIAMLMPDTITADQVRRVLSQRPPGGWSSTNEFWHDTSLAAGGQPGDADEQVAITTRWFALRTDVAIGRISMRETGLIDAGRPPAKLVYRQWGDAG